MADRINRPTQMGAWVLINERWYKEKDAARVKEIDGVSARDVSNRHVVGVSREARHLGIALEDYFQIWKDGIKKSNLSEPLKGKVLSSIDYNDYFGLGVIVITVTPQTEMSFVGDDVFCREGDSTIRVVGAKAIADLAKRF